MRSARSVVTDTISNIPRCELFLGPVVLFGAGAGVPENLENFIERRYFSAIHYLALVCPDSTLTDRLNARPAWRGSHQTDFIEEQKCFNQWFMDYNKTGLQPAIRLLDTTHISLDETVQEVTTWLMNIFLVCQDMRLVWCANKIIKEVIS